jgi:ABC-2 type transport system ATP-binding protein
MTLRFHDIWFRYQRGAAPVLSGFSWSVRPGKTVLLGPNGAGKSTLLALGADALRPNRGEIELDSLNPRLRGDRAPFRRRVGWVPQQARAVPGLTAREQVAYAGWLKGMPGDEAWSSAESALTAVGLQDRAGERTTRLSGGQLRRVGLAQALVHDPEVFLLDEPTAGLDPAQRARFRELLTAFAPERPLVVSTHQVDDLSELFEWVVVLLDGSIRFDGPVTAFLDLAPAGVQRPAEAAYAQIALGQH